MLKFLIVLIIGLNQIEANSFTFGSCAKSPVIVDFDITKVIVTSEILEIFLNFNYYFKILKSILVNGMKSNISKLHSNQI